MQGSMKPEFRPQQQAYHKGAAALCWSANAGRASCGLSCCCRYLEHSVVVPPGQHPRRNRLMRERYVNSWPRRAPVHRSREATPILTSAWSRAANAPN